MDDAPPRILSAVALPIIDPDGPFNARLQAGDEGALDVRAPALLPALRALADFGRHGPGQVRWPP